MGPDFIYAGAIQGWRWSIHGCNAAATNEQKGLRLASVRPSEARVVRPSPRVPLVACFTFSPLCVSGSGCILPMCLQLKIQRSPGALLSFFQLRVAFNSCALVIYDKNFPGFKFTACPWTACAIIFEGKSSRKLFGSHNTSAVKVHSRGIKS